MGVGFRATRTTLATIGVGKDALQRDGPISGKPTNIFYPEQGSQFLARALLEMYVKGRARNQVHKISLQQKILYLLKKGTLA